MKNNFIFRIYVILLLMLATGVQAQEEAAKQEVKIEVEGDQEGRTFHVKILTEKDGAMHSYERTYGSLDEMETDSLVIQVTKGELDHLVDFDPDSLGDQFHWTGTSGRSGQQVVHTKGETIIIIDEEENPEGADERDPSSVMYEYNIELLDDKDSDSEQEKVEKEILVFRDEEGKVTVRTGNRPVNREVTVPEVNLGEISADEHEFTNFNLDALPRLNLKNLNYYPNPNQGEFTLSFSGARKPVIIRILDPAGNLKFEEINNDFDGNFNQVINLKNYDEGSYLLQVHQQGKVLNRKITIR